MYRVLRTSLLRPPSHWMGVTSSKHLSTTPRQCQNENGLPQTADAVIIGGGVIGCCTFYQLAKMGMTNIVLLEKAQLTAGTTWHTAGLVWSLRPSDVDQQLLKVSRNLMNSLEEETGVHPGYINNGGLFVASNKERLDEYQRSSTLGKAFNIESHVLGPEETKKLYPLMNVDDVFGTLYSPEDGTIDPAGYCNALTRGAKNRGAKMFENTGVTGINVVTDDYGTRRIQGVNTEHGYIDTKCVVNCAGAWAPYLGAMAGVDVPLIPWKHAYVVTDRIEGIQNMPNVRDHDASLYLKLQGDALCVGGYEPNPVFLDNDRVAKDFEFGLYELDWDVFTFNLEGAMHRVPIIEKTGVKSTVCGPESFTADHKPLVGESPDVRGFYFGCGFNSMGMMMSGGVCEELSKWIIHGKPDADMYGMDIRRFTTKLTSNQRWIKERSHESYAKTYSIVFPHDEPLASRGMRKDALYDVLSEAGCMYQEKQGWERPGWYTNDGPAVPMKYDFYGFYGNEENKNNRYKEKLNLDYTFDFPKHHDLLGAECLAVRNSVAAYNMSYFGKYYLVGPDAQAAADWIFTANMQKAAGSTVYTCMCNYRGGVEGDLTVSMMDGGSGRPHDPSFEGRGFFVAVGGAVAQYASSHIMDIIQDKNFDCRLIDHSDDMILLSVQGPKSRAVLESISDTDFSNEAFPFSTHKLVKIAGHEVRALRVSFVGELGWELHASNDDAVAVYKAVMAAGEKYNIVNSGYRALDSLSIEKGYRHWHADIRSDDTPLEGGLAFTCKLKTDTPFLGREALEAQKKEGLKKRIACFTLDDHVPLNGLEAIYRDGTAVGFLRRGEYAFALRKSIGYGYVDAGGEKVTMDYLKTGSWSIERMGVRYPATLHTKSPFDPKNKRVNGIYDEPLHIYS